MKPVRRKRAARKGAACKKKKKKEVSTAPTASPPRDVDIESQSAQESSSSESVGKGDEVEDDLHGESHPIDPISDTMLAEAKNANELVQEVSHADLKKAELAEQHHSSGKVTSSSSFFNKAFGLDAGALAATGRSICLFCKMRIPKGDVRFSWSYSTVRPHAWVHSHCVFQLAQQTDLQDSTIKVLKDICSKASGSNGPDTVQQSAESILRAFNSQ